MKDNLYKRISLLSLGSLLLIFFWLACSPAQPNGPDGISPQESADADGGQQAGPDNSQSENPIQKSTKSWHKDIFPIMQLHCVSCHRKGGIGPFELETYEQVKSKASLIKWAVESRRMPPWMPDKTGLSLHGVRSLLDKDIKDIKEWANGGTPQGNAADAPKLNIKPEQLEWVDKTVAPLKAYKPSKQGDSDDYHCLIIDPKITEDRDLIGYEVVPGIKAIVHHVIVYPVVLKDALAKESSPGSGYTCYGGPKVAAPKGINRMIGGWVPGTTVTVFPKGTGMRLPKGVGLVMQIHYNFDQAGSEADLTKLRLQFAKSPVQLQLKIAGVSSNAKNNGTGLNIPAGAKMHEENGSIVGGPARLWGVLPHMHALGRKIRVDLEHPDGKKTTLINIPKWDFNWQQTYFFSSDKGFVTQKGSKLRVRCWFDNPGKQAVRWGESTSEEMCLNYIYYTLK